MYLLDVIPVDPETRIRRIRDIKPVIEDSIDTICDSIGATKDAIADSAAQSQLILDNVNASQSDASLLLPIAVVALALSACLYLAHLYKKRMASSR